MVALSQLVSHRFRGFSDVENTIEGLENALNFGVQQVEFDIRVAKCGTPLIYHDEFAMDGEGVKRHICDIESKQRNDLKGAFTHMPTAKDLFMAAAKHQNKAWLHVDIKDVGFEELLIKLADDFNLLDRIVWVSWFPEALYRIREILPNAKLTFSYWCQSPSAGTRSRHIIYTSKNQEIPNPQRHLVHGERSGWYVEGALQGELRSIINSVCVPVNMVTAELVENYHQDSITVCAFSYKQRDTLEAASQLYKLDDFFIDSKTVFDSFEPI